MISAFILISLILYAFQEKIIPYSDDEYLRTSYSNSISGTYGFFITLSELKYNAQRYKRDFNNLSDKECGIMIIPATYCIREFMPSEWTALKEWVKKGNTAVIFIDSFLNHHQNTYEMKTYPLWKSAITENVKCITLNENRHQQYSKRYSGKLKTFADKTDEFISNQIADSVALAGKNDKSYIFAKPEGNGIIYLINGNRIISNEGILKPDNFIFLMNIIDISLTGKDKIIFFDEYHNNFGSNRNLWSTFPVMVKTGVIQILIAIALLLFYLSRRTTAPVNYETGGRSRAEYISSMADIFKKAKANSAAAEKLCDKFFRDVRSSLFLPETCKVEDIINIFEKQKKGRSEKFKMLLNTAGKISQRPAKTETIIDFSKKADSFIKDIKQ